MVADILVLPNRHFGLTDAQGRYRLDAAPAGDYVVRVWHVYGGVDQKTVRVGAPDQTVDFTVRSVQSAEDLVEHPDKAGKGYAQPTSESY
jgi:hypothetical protein